MWQGKATAARRPLCARRAAAVAGEQGTLKGRIRGSPIPAANRTFLQPNTGPRQEAEGQQINTSARAQVARVLLPLIRPVDCDDRG